MELKHSINGAGGAEISKIRNLRPKQRRFGLSKKKIYIAFWSLLQKKKKNLRASLHSPTTEKMEKKKKKKKENKKKGKKKPRKCLRRGATAGSGRASSLRRTFDNYD